MLLAVCADRGSPGTTTTSLSLAAAWAAQRGSSIVVEADPYGGDLGIRCRVSRSRVLAETPTVLTVASSARGDQSPGLIAEHAQRFVDGVRLVPGHLSAEQARGIDDWSSLGASLVAASAAELVIADLGRIHSQSPSFPIAASADVLMVVCRADLSGVLHLRDRLARLAVALSSQGDRRPVVVPLVIASRRAGERLASDIDALVAEDLVEGSVNKCSWLAWDPKAVTRLESGEAPDGPLGRTPLIRSASDVLARIQAERTEA